jgi:CRP-like cAMP-binding protein
MTRASMETILGTHRVLSGLDPAILDVVAGCARSRAFAPGGRLAAEGDRVDHLYLLHAGHVGLDLRAPGRGVLRILTVGPDEALGLGWLVPPQIWHCDCTALDEVEAVEIDAACLRGRCEGDPAAGYAVLKRFVQPLVERLRDARLQQLDLYGPAR